jgi:hypothetical protein
MDTQAENTRPPIEAGDRVVVRPEYRRLFNDGSPAARGEALVVLGRNLSAWSIGPKPLDYAYDYELQPATLEAG